MQSWAPFNNAYLFISELVWLCCPHRDINTFQLLQNKKCIYTKLKCTHYGITQTHTHTFAFACLFKKAFPPCFKHTTDPGSTREAADTRVFRADKPWGAYGAFLEHFFFFHLLYFHLGAIRRRLVATSPNGFTCRSNKHLNTCREQHTKAEDINPDVSKGEKKIPITLTKEGSEWGRKRGDDDILQWGPWLKDKLFVQIPDRGFHYSLFGHAVFTQSEPCSS